MSDPLDPSSYDALAMTHWPDDPRAAEVARRLQRTGQNIWNTWGAPVQAAKQLGQAATSGTLDVTNPQTAGKALKLASGIAGVRAPLAGAGELGAVGGKPALTGMDIFAQRIHELVRKMPDTGYHEGKVAIGDLYDAYRKAFPREYESPKTFGYRLVNAAKARKLNLARLDLPEGLENDLRLRSQTPWGNDEVHFVVRSTR